MSNIGRRDPSIYGSFASIEELVEFVRDGARSLGVELCADICSNHEGVLVEWIHGAWDRVDGLVVNPAGLTAGGQSMRDALRDCGLRWVEVHCANLVTVDQPSIFTKWASGTCHGMRSNSYIAGLAGLIGVLEDGALEQADVRAAEG